MTEWKPLEAKWSGDSSILPTNATVMILACDPSDPNVPARMPCWVRYWPKGRDYPMYRSCDLCDLTLEDADYDRLPPPSLRIR